MSEAGEREALIAAIWGTPRARAEQFREHRSSRRNLSGLAVAGGAATAVATAILTPIGGMAVAALAGVSSSLIWVVGNRSAYRTRNDYPIGGGSLHFAAGPRLSWRGRADGDSDLVAPASGLSCVAFALELRFDSASGPRTMYRDAITVGFTVELDSGETARIPPGRVRLIGPMRQAIDFDNLGLEAYLKEFDRRRSHGTELDPLRYNAVYELTLLPGDRVELISEFEPAVHPETGETHYRESPSSIAIPLGVPVLRLLENSD